MRLLALDIGSSSIKAAVLVDGRLPRRIARVAFATSYTIDRDGRARATVAVADVEAAIRTSLDKLGPAIRKVDLIAPATMSPSWVALDAKGKALTPIVTHQDRRSIDVAHEIESRVGRSRHLKLAGNRPVPGGISSTTWAWHLEHESSRMRRASLVGHLGTWLAYAFTGERVIDTSNAGFTGLMDVRRQVWSDELIDAVGVDRSLLPRIVESNAIVGRVTTTAAGRFGLTAGTPMLAGCVDGSAAMFAAGAAVGRLVNVSGSTDVLALCTDTPRPSDELLTRPLGVGRRWLAVGTIAAAGTAIEWARTTFYSELKPAAFYVKLRAVAADRSAKGRVQFNNWLAGSRTALDAPKTSMAGLTLSTSRDEILRGLIDDLAAKSAARFDAFAAAGLPTPLRDVFVTGGLNENLAGALRRAWPRGFRFRGEPEATLRGLAALASDVRD